jgi:hypothetical protein
MANWPAFWAERRLMCHSRHVDAALARRIEALERQRNLMGFEPVRGPRISLRSCRHHQISSGSFRLACPSRPVIM